PRDSARGSADGGSRTAHKRAYETRSPARRLLVTSPPPLTWHCYMLHGFTHHSAQSCAQSVAAPALRAEDCATLTTAPAWTMRSDEKPDPPAPAPPAYIVVLNAVPSGRFVFSVTWPPVSVDVTWSPLIAVTRWSCPSFGAVHETTVPVPLTRAYPL